MRNAYLIFVFNKSAIEKLFRVVWWKIILCWYYSVELAIHQKANLEFANPSAYDYKGHAVLTKKKPKKNLPNS